MRERIWLYVGEEEKDQQQKEMDEWKINNALSQ
jgi:hypothetical protein